MSQTTEKKKQTPQENYATARGALLFFCICTVMNTIFRIFHVDWQFVYMSALAQTVSDLGDGLLYGLAGLCIAGVFTVLWVFSEKNRAMMTWALALYIVDCVFSVPEFAAGEVSGALVLRVGLRLLVLWALIAGVRAAREIKKMEETPMLLIVEDEDKETASESEKGEK